MDHQSLLPEWEGINIKDYCSYPDDQNPLEPTVDPPEWLGRLAPPVIQTDNATRACSSCSKHIQKVFEGESKWVKSQIVPDPSCSFCSTVRSKGKYPHDLGSWWLINMRQVPERSNDTIRIVELSIWSRDGEGDKIEIETPKPNYSESVRLHPQDKTPTINSLLIDFRSLKDMLEHCKEKHQRSCNSQPKDHVHGLYMINCETRMIERVKTEVSYVALSYVWGEPGQSVQTDCADDILELVREKMSGDFTGAEMVSGKLPRQMDQTLEDALRVTLEMGYAYLWVDKYCIQQQDPEKHVYIRRMDSIYRNADFTIIAAAGIDATYGLPGVSTRPRTPMAHCRIGDMLLLRHRVRSWIESKNYSQLQRLSLSKWNTRGWTYQEGLLSTRCLVFTDQEVSFTCQGTSLLEGSETRSSPPSSLEKFESPRLYGREIVSCGLSGTPFDFFDRVRQYGLRSLTYQDDALDAFSGILRAFEKTNPPIYHLWGVSVLPLRCQKDILSRSSFVNTSSSDGFVRGLGWLNPWDTTLTRRPGFPSWSWVGWEGAIDEMANQMEVDDDLKDIKPLCVGVELRDGTKLTWAELEKRGYLKDESDKLSHFILLEAWTTKVLVAAPTSTTVSYIFAMGRDGQRATLPIRASNSLLEEFAKKGDPPILAFTGILLCSPEAVIIVKFDGETAERIALCFPARIFKISANASNNNGSNDHLERRISERLEFHWELKRRVIRLG